MIANPYQKYKSTSVATADSGKLVLMVYDHCLKWCKKAIDELEHENLEKANKALSRVQDGLTELMCALDRERGGDISANLYRLYDFYGRHLTTAIRGRDTKPINDVIRMMANLREAWVGAIENVRRDGTTLSSPSIESGTLKMVG